MLIYYNPADGQLLHTMRPSPDVAPPGDFISVPDDTVVTPMKSFQVVDDTLVDADLTPAKDLAIDQVNTLTGEVRRKYITVIPGQDMLYKEKEIQAVNYLAASPEPNTVTGWETEYPSIAREVGITADTAYNVAMTIAQMADIWRDIGSQLDQVRLSTIKTIEEATDRSTIDLANSTFRTSMELF